MLNLTRLMKPRGPVFVTAFLFAIGSLFFHKDALCEKTFRTETIITDTPIAIISDVQGDVALIRQGEEYKITHAGLALKEGDVVLVKDNPAVSDSATIFLSKDRKSAVSLGENAVLIISELGVRGAKKIFLEALNVGADTEAVFDIQHASPLSPFFIYTPDGIIGVRGTAFAVRTRNLADLTLTTQVIPHHTGAVDCSYENCPWDGRDISFSALDCEATLHNLLGPPPEGSSYSCATMANFANNYAAINDLLLQANKIAVAGNLTASSQSELRCDLADRSECYLTERRQVGLRWRDPMMPSQVELSISNMDASAIYLIEESKEKIKKGKKAQKEKSARKEKYHYQQAMVEAKKLNGKAVIGSTPYPAPYPVPYATANAGDQGDDFDWSQWLEAALDWVKTNIIEPCYDAINNALSNWFSF